MTEVYDLIVIGAGAAGSGAALKAARQGHRVALIEKDHIGGSCTNYGCDPSKRLLYTANLLHRAQQLDTLGLSGGDKVTANWLLVQQRLHDLVVTMRGGENLEESGRYYEERGIDVYAGSAAFVNAHTLQIGTEQVRGDRILIAAGSRPLIPPIDGVDEVPYLTNREALFLPQLPGSMIVVGAGPLGVELAQVFGRFGTRVTLIEADDHILPKDDAELSEALRVILEAEGIDVQLKMAVEAVQMNAGAIEATLRYASGHQDTISAEHLLLAVGRAPDLEGLNLAAAGVEIDDDGWIRVDETQRTNVAHIFAAGDVTGGYQFTHVASSQGAVALHNAFADEPQSFNDTAIPWVTYTDPALAHVGRTAHQLDKEGIAYELLRKPLSETSRAKIEQRPAGMIKLVVGEDGRLLGGSILGPHAGDLIAPLCVAMRHELPVSALAHTILPYPTWAAEIRTAASQG
ncbi:MAG: NAD(P)/FAD-dependent oxidoreductase [Anaerolineae bacterium]|nr:NAD(P)/FAD-dependent oxidoreductase [Anaerolineae bacterium]